MADTHPPERSPVVSLCDVRRSRQHAQTADRQKPQTSDRDGRLQTADPTGPFPDLAAIAREPSYAVRRRKLADAMRQVSGSEPDARILDHQMILLGLAAGHGCASHGSEDDDADDGAPWPFGSGFADPAVVVGLVLHHTEQGAKRGMAIPKSLLAALDDHVAAGSAAARLVRDWLEARSVPCGRRRLWVHEGGKP